MCSVCYVLLWLLFVLFLFYYVTFVMFLFSYFYALLCFRFVIIMFDMFIENVGL